MIKRPHNLTHDHRSKAAAHTLLANKLHNSSVYTFTSEFSTQVDSLFNQIQLQVTRNYSNFVHGTDPIESGDLAALLRGGKKRPGTRYPTVMLIEYCFWGPCAS